MNVSTDRIEKHVLLNAPRERAWRAITPRGGVRIQRGRLGGPVLADPEYLQSDNPPG